MTSEQIEIVRASFSKIKPLVEEAAVLFYARLFERDPSLRALFNIDIREQGHKLMQVIGFAVEHLDNLDNIKPTLHELGARHVDYGVRDAHYDTVAEALLWTLRKALKTEYTPDVDDAWATVLNLLSNTMKEGAKQASPSAVSIN